MQLFCGGCPSHISADLQWMWHQIGIYEADINYTYILHFSPPTHFLPHIYWHPHNLTQPQIVELSDMREEILSRVSAAIVEVCEYRDSYNSYSYLWVDDRQEFLQQFLLYGHMLTQEEIEAAGKTLLVLNCRFWKQWNEANWELVASYKSCLGTTWEQSCVHYMLVCTSVST